ncbi:serine hydrolase domain-containing protein [Sphingomicrobium nitratireducens]|uniref:serine hydrolase domain-containing protein n=1 Tax=Sphingomicrobium nitratireducens TaxID=2964666 RepID=UPI00223EBF7C|nr:serine hydrolase domain-containing protein [Sphingomicrobium nitratireducens]
MISRLLIAGGMAAAAALVAVALPRGAGGEDGPVLTDSATIPVPPLHDFAKGPIDYARLDARASRLVGEERSMVGLAVGVVENGRISFLKGYGETAKDSGEKVRFDTVFRWASVSKGVAGTMAAKLASEGSLQLDAPIATYSATLLLPQGAQVTATVRDVLSHRLGLWRNAFDDRLEDGQDPRDIRRQLGSLVLTCPPGTCWSYQNVAFDTASEVVAKTTGTSYQQAVEEELFAPLGMTSASLTREGLVGAKSWAHPHSAWASELEVKEPYYRVPAAGGVNSNIKDMAIWLQAQVGALPEIVEPQVLETAHEALVKTPNENSRMRKYRERVHDPYYGLGWRSYDYSGHHVVGHRGGVDGYRSLIMFDPEKKTGIVALWNSNTSQPTGLQFELLDMLYGLEFRDWLELDKG